MDDALRIVRVLNLTNWEDDKQINIDIDEISMAYSQYKSQMSFTEAMEKAKGEWLKKHFDLVGKTKRTLVTIEIPDEIFMTLALMAHEQDITFNQLVTNILKEYIEKHEMPNL